MTNLYPNPTFDTISSGANVGNAPVAGTAMQGNPNPEPIGGLAPPAPQNTPSQLLATQISNGSIPLHTHPTNVAGPPGVDSLLAQLSRGQVILKDSTYGMAQYIPGNAGAGPVPVPSASVAAVATGPASGVSIANPPVYTGT